MSFVAAGLLFVCTPVSVWDGDGPVACAEGPKLRLAGIAAREMDGTCRRNQPCPKASAQAARDALARLLGGARGRSRDGHVLVRGPRLSCRSLGDGRYGRTAATCTLPASRTAPARDLGCALLATGTVLRWRRYWPGTRCPRLRPG